MGIQGLWKFLLKTGYSPGVVQIPTGNLLPRGRLYHVDLAGILYSDIRGAYRNADYEVANKIMDVSLVRQGFHKDSTAIYIDGPPPAQKMTARELREKKHGNDTLSRNPPPFNVASREGKRVEKSPYTHLSRSLFYPFHEKGESLARYLAQKDWCAIACPSEADIAIGEACGKEDIVITSDSDALAYANIHTIWRPFDGGYLVYEVPKVLQHLSLSRVSLTALAVVCSNDYTKKVISMKANLEILKSLETKGKGHDDMSDFSPSLLVLYFFD